MPLKFFGIDASGKRVALTVTGSSFRANIDALQIGDAVFIRNSGDFSAASGSTRFVALEIEEEQEQLSGPKEEPKRQEPTRPVAATSDRKPDTRKS